MYFFYKFEPSDLTQLNHKKDKSVIHRWQRRRGVNLIDIYLEIAITNCIDPDNIR